MRTLVFTTEGELAVDDSHAPLLIDAPGAVIIDASTSASYASATLIDMVYQRGGSFVPAVGHLSDRRVARGLALLSNQQQLRFDPVDGSAVNFDDHGVVARGQSGRPIFPRIDPAVIGLVTLAGTDCILLGRNRRRSYFSLIAGYIDAGENVEEAFAREVLEETGRRINNPRYWGSQPFPMGGSLMVGLRASTEDEHPIAETDGELEEIIWASPLELENLPLAPRGSIAHEMLHDYCVRVRTTGLEG